MSDTTQGAAATAPASTGGFAPWTMLSGFFKAVEAGAASIYHRLLSAESVVQNWTLRMRSLRR